MENTTQINQKIARNLTYYRKAAGFTQAELAEKINYSDKSVSKWESGNGVPDIYILLELAKLYGVSVNDLVGDEPCTETKIVSDKKKAFGARLLIALLSSGIVWLVATCLFVLFELMQPQGDWWILFLYAIPVNCILLIVYAGIWKYRMLGFVSVSLLVWSILTGLYITIRLLLFHFSGGQAGAYWLLFLLGVPLQGLEILWVFFRSLFQKNKTEESVRLEETETVNK